MKYTMKSGALYYQDIALARIKSMLNGPKKEIISSEGEFLLECDIHNLNGPSEKRGDVRYHQYIMAEADGKKCAVGKPGYANGDDPDVVGWPVCRMPKADHVQLTLQGGIYYLIMRNNQNYCLENQSRETVVQIFHRGLIGGWDIDAADEIPPEGICGIFVFCRYLEQENEFMVV